MIRSRTTVLSFALVLAAGLALTGPAVAGDATKPMVWPTTGRITQPYGCTGFSWEPRYGSCRHFHGGIDIANNRGTPIRAAAGGTITYVGWDQWGTRNWMVIINHAGSLTTWYGHMRNKQLDGIRKGVRVRQGEVIGYMSDTGLATGVHLHWSVLKNGAYVNPRNYVAGLPFRPRKRGSPTSAASCDDVWIASAPAPGAATAVVLEGEDGSGGQDVNCAA